MSGRYDYTDYDDHHMIPRPAQEETRHQDES